MKVILIQDVEGLGKKYDVKNVSNGYARNHLLPNNLVKEATKEALKWLEMQSEIIEKEREEELKKIQKTVSKIDGFELNFTVKVGDKGQLFESINEQKIKDALKEEAGVEVSKKQVVLSEPIKEVGEFSLKINFDHNLEANIKVLVSEE